MRIITALVSVVAILAAGAPAMPFAVASGVLANCAGHTIRLSEIEKALSSGLPAWRYGGGMRS